MSRWTGWLGALGAGAAAMFILDPERGRRRRALLRDKLVSARHQLGDASDTVARDVMNRGRGQVARVQSLFTGRPPSDAHIAERVRSRLRYAVSHPRSIEVWVHDGRVTVSGPVLAAEAEELLCEVESVRGVQAVEDRLTRHATPGDVPGLQGAPARRPRGGGTLSFTQTVWSPTARLVAGAAGAAMTVWGLRLGGALGILSGVGGLAVLLRGLTNLELKRLTGIAAGRQAVRLQKTITVNAPIERVFEAWSRYEDFPKFMWHVREVRHTGDRRTHWVVEGPAGAMVEWDCEETARVANEILAWRTVPGSVAEHAGTVHFERAEGATRIHVEMSWNPPAGAVGHGIAALFGYDPKQALDDGLVRFKSLLEDGRTTTRGQTASDRDIAS